MGKTKKGILNKPKKKGTKADAAFESARSKLTGSQGSRHGQLAKLRKERDAANIKENAAAKYAKRDKDIAANAASAAKKKKDRASDISQVAKIKATMAGKSSVDQTALRKKRQAETGGDQQSATKLANQAKVVKRDPVKSVNEIKKSGIARQKITSDTTGLKAPTTPKKAFKESRLNKARRKKAGNLDDKAEELRAGKGITEKKYNRLKNRAQRKRERAAGDRRGAFKTALTRVGRATVAGLAAQSGENRGFKKGGTKDSAWKTEAGLTKQGQKKKDAFSKPNPSAFKPLGAKTKSLGAAKEQEKKKNK